MRRLIRMLKESAGPVAPYREGVEYGVSAEVAAQLVGSGVATYVDEAPVIAESGPEPGKVQVPSDEDTDAVAADAPDEDVPDAPKKSRRRRG